MKLSIEQASNVPTENVDTIADGIAVREPVDYALSSLDLIIDEVVAVSDERIMHAIAICANTLGLIIEPAGAAGLAAILDNRDAWKNKSVATVLCGSNIDPSLFQRCLSR